MEIVTILIVVAVSVVFGLIGGGFAFIIKMKLGERKTKKQLKSGKGIIENITPKEKTEEKTTPIENIKENLEDKKEEYPDEYFK